MDRRRRSRRPSDSQATAVSAKILRRLRWGGEALSETLREFANLAAEALALGIISVIAAFALLVVLLDWAGRRKERRARQRPMA